MPTYPRYFRRKDWPTGDLNVIDSPGGAVFSHVDGKRTGTVNRTERDLDRYVAEGDHWIEITCSKDWPEGVVGAMDAHRVASIAHAVLGNSPLVEVSADLVPGGCFKVTITYQNFIEFYVPHDEPMKTPADNIADAARSVIRGLALDIDQDMRHLCNVDAGTRHFKSPIAPEPPQGHVWSFLCLPNSCEVIQ